MDELKQLFESGVLSKEAKEALTEAWEAKITEARSEIAAELREEFASKYRKDREDIVKGMNDMISETVSALVKEHKEAMEKSKKLTESKKDTLKKFTQFAATRLAEEVKELRQDKINEAKKFNKFGKFIRESTGRELAEFNEETRKLSEARVKVISEGYKKVEEAKKAFIKNASEKAHKWLTESFSKQIKDLKEDIDQAKKSRYGQKIFEAFNHEFEAYFFEKNSKFNKLRNEMKEYHKKIEEANAEANQLKEKLSESQKKIRIANDRLIREKKLNESLAHLPRDKRRVMAELVEDVTTDRLDEAISRYLPMVEEGETPRKKRSLRENKGSRKVVTGNRQPLTEDVKEEVDNDYDKDIEDIVRLSRVK